MKGSQRISIDTNINLTDWLTFIQKCPQKEIFQTPHMQIVFEKTKNYNPFCFFARDEKDEIVASLLAYTIREPVPFSYFSRRAIVEGGPLFLENKTGKLAARLLVEEFSKKIKKYAIFAEVRNHRPTVDYQFCFQNTKFNYIEHVNVLIDLTQGEDQVWKRMNKRKKGKIKQAMKRGVTCKRIENESEMRELFLILLETYKRIKIPPVDESLFLAIFHELVQKNLAFPLITKYEGKIIGGIVPLLFEEVIYGWFLVGLEEYFRFYHQNDLVIWELLKWGCENKYKVFDFGGGGDPNIPSGLRDFKMQFGGKLTKFPRYQYVLHPYYNKISQTGFKLWKRLRQHF